MTDPPRYHSAKDLWLLLPGSHTLAWAERLGESPALTPSSCALRFLYAQAADGVKLALWGGGVYGLLKLAHDPAVQSALEKLF